MTHARLSPSNHRWVHCPGSVEAEKEYPDISGDSAIDGTGSHLLLEQCLLTNREPDVYLGRIIGVGHEDRAQGWRVDDERVSRVNMALAYIKRRRKEIKRQFGKVTIEVLTEERVNPGELYGRDDWFGTSDIVIRVHDERWRPVLVEIVDYKDGRLFVSAENNSQLQSYALGAISRFIENDSGELVTIERNWDFNIRMTIVQPRTSKPIRYEDIKVSELLCIGADLNKAARRTDDDGAPLVADPYDGNGWCRWCKHRANCPALNSTYKEKISVMNELTTIGDALEKVETLDNEKLAELYDAKPAIDALFKRLEDEMNKRLDEDQKIPGYGRVPGRAMKVWNAPQDEIVEMLKKKRLSKAEIIEEKLRSPAQILKMKKLTSQVRERILRDYVSERITTYKLGRIKKEEKTVKTMFEALPEVKKLPSFL